MGVGYHTGSARICTSSQADDRGLSVGITMAWPLEVPVPCRGSSTGIGACCGRGAGSEEADDGGEVITDDDIVDG